jgi:hypothetical protein
VRRGSTYQFTIMPQSRAMAHECPLTVRSPLPAVRTGTGAAHLYGGELALTAQAA